MALEILAAENALRLVREAQTALDEEYGLDPATNLYRKELPPWAAQVRDRLHAASEALIAAIDPNFDR